MTAALGAALALVLLAGQGASRESQLALLGPEVYKLDWNTRSLVAHDLDGDERIDLAVLNNDRARVDLLYQASGGKKERRRTTGHNRRWQPVLEDARFRKETLVTGITTYALAVGDLDGDGRADLAYTGRPDGLTIRYQGKDGDWARKRVIEIGDPAPWAASLAVADLDDDGAVDLVVLTTGELLVFHQEDGGGLEGPRHLQLADGDCHGLAVQDLDGDGRVDLRYLASGSTHPLRIRLQGPDGRFGPEQALHLEEPLGGMVGVRGATRNGIGLAYVQDRARVLDLVAVETGASGRDLEAIDLRPRVFAVPVASGMTPAYAVGDLDGDDRPDVAATDPRGARVLLYLQSGQGGPGGATPYPSFTDVRSVATGDLDGDGRDELFVASPQEKTVGVSRLLATGRLSYPEAMPTRGTPLAVAAGDLDEDGSLEVVVAFQEDGVRGVAVRSTPDRGKTWGEETIELTGLRTDPMAVRILDANQDDLPDIAVFTLQDHLRLLLQERGGGFTEVTAAATFRRSLVDKLLPHGLSMADVDGDGRDEMLVAGRGQARAMRITPTGELEVVDQFNARKSDAAVAVAVAVDLDGDGTQEILLQEKGGDALQLLQKDAQGVYRYRRSIATGQIDLVDTEIRDLNGRGGPDLLLLGKDRFWWIPLGDTDLRARSLSTHETDLEEMHYTQLVAGDLDGDGADEIIAVDTMESRLLELLSPDADGRWESSFHFTIFESDPHYAGRSGAASEPREMLIADLTADGKPDLALLIHDRILLYPQP